jgi:CelD/BcsL family acetyltransferase involved in cellulose biosynthesis
MEHLASIDDLLAFESEWWDLWASDPGATPFQSPAWLIPWVRHLWGGGAIRALVTRRHSAAIGFAPLFLWGFGSGAVRVSFLGSGISDYLDVLAAPKARECVAREVIESLLGSADWDECDLEELRSDSSLLAAGRSMSCATVEPCSVCPALALPAQMDELVSSLEQKFRTDIRRAENRLHSAGSLEFVTAADSATAAELMETLIRLHSARWRKRDEAGVLNTDCLIEFHREAAARFLERGILRLHGLKLNGETIAVQYNFAARTSTYAYLSGFEPAWSKHSPGAVLLKYSISEAVTEGSQCFDFLRKQEAFKYEWRAVDRVNFRLHLTNRRRLEQPE